MNAPHDPQQVEDLVKATVKETLLQLGADVDNPREMQADFQALREWREAYSSVKKKTLLTFIGILVGGLVAAVWVGLKSYIAPQ